MTYHIERDRQYARTKKAKRRCHNIPAAYNLLNKSPFSVRVRETHNAWMCRVGRLILRKEWRGHSFRNKFRYHQLQRVLAGLDHRELSYHRYKPPMKWTIRRMIDRIKRETK